MKWLLPHGYMIVWDAFRDEFRCDSPTKNYGVMLPHPDSVMLYDDWISLVERCANVSPGTFTKELGDFYGEYRKAKSQIYGSTYQSPYQSAGGPQSHYANQNAQAQYANYCAAAQQAAYSNSLTGVGPMTNPGFLPQSALGSGPQPLPPPHAPTNLKSEGIRAGEIIAWRSWIVSGDVLRSAVVSQHEWNPREPMSGDPAAGYGINAYKGPHGPLLDGFVQKGSGKWVIVEVALWGEIIEHEEGYRAEFARVHSLVTWSENISAHLRQVITEKYITSQPVYKIEGEDDALPLLPRAHGSQA